MKLIKKSSIVKKGSRPVKERTKYTTDSFVVDVLDRALTAAEGELKALLRVDGYAPPFIARAFADHVRTHLEEELVNIVVHGHRNDDAADVPAGSAPKRKARRGRKQSNLDRALEVRVGD